MKSQRFSRLLFLSILTLLIGCHTVPVGTTQQSKAEAITDMSASDSLTEAEINGLLLMREEEKLARDVYRVLYEQWQHRIFNNIAQSEQTHTNAIKTLLQKYGLNDPVINDSIGVFQNEQLQSLYNQLIEKGKISLVEALHVGALIEEIDILDLQNELNHLNGNDDIAFVYQNLMRGSRNHLRAFVKNLKRLGITYIPVKLAQDEFDAIINSNWETGKK